MKREHELNILLIAVLGGLAACFVWMFAGTGTWKSATGSRGLGFGNCSAQYQWRSRNDGPQEILNLVVLSEEPSKYEVRNEGKEAFARFSDGSSSVVVPDDSSIAWLAPGKQPRCLEVGDLRAIVTQIEQHRSTNSDAQFSSPEEFLAGIQKLAEETGHTELRQPSS